MAGVEHAERPPRAAPVQAQVDRRAAIEQAVALARDGDVLVIAGKGHEQGQEFARGVKLPFDDVSVAREALRCRRLQGVQPSEQAEQAATKARGG